MCVTYTGVILIPRLPISKYESRVKIRIGNKIKELYVKSTHTNPQQGGTLIEFVFKLPTR